MIKKKAKAKKNKKKKKNKLKTILKTKKDKQYIIGFLVFFLKNTKHPDFNKKKKSYFLIKYSGYIVLY
jgi:hypothetical protein